jgi:hypothetical protein
LPAVPPLEPPPLASRTAELGKAIAKRIAQATLVEFAALGVLRQLLKGILIIRSYTGSHLVLKTLQMKWDSREDQRRSRKNPPNGV